MKTYKTYYKRNLPHYQPLGYTFFVTYRLDGSLPVEVIERLKEEREKELKVIAGYDNQKIRREKYKNYQSRYFGKFDKLLDNASYGPTWLKNEEVAQIVKDAMHYYDKKAYDLICYTIMSNHVHQVFTPIVNRISDSTKGENAGPRNGIPDYDDVVRISDSTKGENAGPRNGVSDYNDVGRISDSTKGENAGPRNGVSDYNDVGRIPDSTKGENAGPRNGIPDYDDVVRISDSTKGENAGPRNGVSSYNTINQISDSKNLETEDGIYRNRVSEYIVSKILQDLKRYTSGKCNKALNRSGTFWQHESYDHVVRDHKELIRIVNYVLNNPIKTGLCEKWENWKWSYCNFDLL